MPGASGCEGSGADRAAILPGLAVQGDRPAARQNARCVACSTDAYVRSPAPAPEDPAREQLELRVRASRRAWFSVAARLLTSSDSRLCSAILVTQLTLHAASSLRLPQCAAHRRVPELCGLAPARASVAGSRRGDVTVLVGTVSRYSID